VAGMNSYVI